MDKASNAVYVCSGVTKARNISTTSRDAKTKSLSVMIRSTSGPVVSEIFPNVYQTCLHLPTPSSSLLASTETTMSFMMANATPSTGDAMVQTEWRSPTGSALLVAVKLDLSSTIRE